MLLYHVPSPPVRGCCSLFHHEQTTLTGRAARPCSSSRSSFPGSLRPPRRSWRPTAGTSQKGAS